MGRDCADPGCAHDQARDRAAPGGCHELPIKHLDLIEHGSSSWSQVQAATGYSRATIASIAQRTVPVASVEGGAARWSSETDDYKVPTRQVSGRLPS
jgi:hypothetical protein